MIRTKLVHLFRLGLCLVLASSNLGIGLAQGEALAGVRFIHLSPDAPLVDLILNESPEQKDLEFGSLTGYVWLTPGRHEVTVYPHRSPEQSNPLSALNLQNVLDNDDAPSRIAPLEPFRMAIDVAENKYYTVALAGFFSPPNEGQDLGSLSLDVEEGTRVTVTGPRSYLLNLNESAVLAGLEPGQYTVNAKREGAKDVQYEVAVSSGQLASLGIALEEGASPQQATTEEGEATPEPTWHRAQLYLYEDSYNSLPKPGHALIRIVHAAPGIGTVELRLSEVLDSEDGTPQTDAELATNIQTLISGASFPSATQFVSLETGSQLFEVFPSGGDFSLTAMPATLSPGTIYTLYLALNLSGQVLTPVPSIDAVLRAPLGE